MSKFDQYYEGREEKKLNIGFLPLGISCHVFLFPSSLPPSLPPYLSGLASQATKPSCTGRDKTETKGFGAGGCWALYD